MYFQTAEDKSAHWSAAAPQMVTLISRLQQQDVPALPAGYLICPSWSGPLMCLHGVHAGIHHGFDMTDSKLHVVVHGVLSTFFTGAGCQGKNRHYIYYYTDYLPTNLPT